MSGNEQLEELRAGSEKTIVDFRKDDESDGYVAELLAYQIQAEDHRAIRKEVSEFGDIQIVHEDADSLRLELRNIDRDIVSELEEIGWGW